ncbi:uncharacterized protein LOC133887320 [Phragmites australis]|uniref:uncharacterized protein LOC133887320 n=1 Tax=Phragmites australis TaxID=29695 RepID=UPI002D779AE9|nr:uncharacterized protein LOC133887320 [Phragmites australis]
MSDGHGDVPGGYFVGRPTNHAAVPESQAAGEQKPATTQTPNGYFVGRPESHHEQQQVPQQTTNPSRSSFLAKCCPCLAGGGAAD